jgi:acetyl-CoA synthetase
MLGQPTDEQLADALKVRVHDALGAAAVPDIIQWAPALPRTRSGKILRRILKKIANGAVDDLGDTTTLADANVVDSLVEISRGN